MRFGPAGPAIFDLRASADPQPLAMSRCIAQYCLK